MNKRIFLIIVFIICLIGLYIQPSLISHNNPPDQIKLSDSMVNVELYKVVNQSASTPSKQVLSASNTFSSPDKPLTDLYEDQNLEKPQFFDPNTQIIDFVKLVDPAIGDVLEHIKLWHGGNLSSDQFNNIIEDKDFSSRFALATNPKNKKCVQSIRDHELMTGILLDHNELNKYVQNHCNLN